MKNETFLNTLSNQVCSLAKEVGLFLKDEVNKLDGSQVETKSLNSLVSYVDKQAEQMLVKKLRELLTGSGFLVEENTATSRGETYRWIVDPLDGTTNYIHRLPVYSISIALEKNGEIILGVVHEANNNETFSAIKGEGAFLDHKQIFASKSQRMENCLLATGFPYYDYSRLEKYMEYLKWCILGTRGVRRFGSAAVDLAYVACGRFDGFFEYGLSPWDVAAGSLLVQEAGGTVTDFSGKNNHVFGKEILASGSGIHKVMLEKAKKLRL